jgi:hypothetical protein
VGATLAVGVLVLALLVRTPATEGDAAERA